MVCDQLIAHLASASTRNRLLTWQAADCPDGNDWDLLEEALANRVSFINDLYFLVHVVVRELQESSLKVQT